MSSHVDRLSDAEYLRRVDELADRVRDGALDEGPTSTTRVTGAP
jgi:hypothetical protein